MTTVREMIGEEIAKAIPIELPRETSDVVLIHPLPTSDGRSISVVTVRRLSAEEYRRAIRSHVTRQRRGIAILMAASGLTYSQVRDLQQADVDAIGAALRALLDDFMAFPGKLEALGF